jgi:hypothetical protein
MLQTVSDGSVMKKRYAFVVAVALVLVGMSLVVLLAGFHNFRRQLERYANVPIQGNKAEVLYRLGYPPEVLGETKKDENGVWQRVYQTDPKVDPKNAMPEDKKVQDYDGWVYPINGDGTRSVTVDFDARSSNVETVTCMDDFSGPPPPKSFVLDSPCAPLLGVVINATEEEVVRRLGRNYRYQLNGVTKNLLYKDVGVEVVLTKGRVYMLKLHRARGDDGAVFKRYARTLIP